MKRLVLGLTFLGCSIFVVLALWLFSRHVPPTFTPAEMAKSWAFMIQGSRKGEERLAALDSVRDSAPYLPDFLRLFPDAKMSYRYFSSNDEPGFILEVDLHGRYWFEMRLPVHFDSECRKVIGFGEPIFLIGEVASVQRDRNGLAATTLNPQGEHRFGLRAWQTLVEQKGNFSAIGYRMVTNQPVPGFATRNIQP